MTKRKVVSLRSRHRDAVVITGYDDADMVLRSPDVEQDASHPHSRFLAGTLLMLDGEAHGSRRRLESPLFSRSSLLRYEVEVLVDSIGQTFAWFGSHDSAARSRGDLVRIVRVMLHRIAATTVGLDVAPSLQESLEFVDCLKALMEGVEVGYDLRDGEAVVAEADRALEMFRRRYLKPSMDRRRRSSTAHPDLIGRMVAADHGFDDSLVLREAVLYVLAATVTTTRSIPHLFDQLHCWWESNPADRDLAHDATFLRSAASESLRLHPTTPAVHRRATAAFHTPDGTPIPAGSLILIDLRSANRDRRRFGPDADTFNPHRSTTEAPTPYGLAFGSGAHACIGRNLAMGSSGDEPPLGMIVRIMQSLADRCAIPDGDQVPVREDERLYDEFVSYPITWYEP